MMTKVVGVLNDGNWYWITRTRTETVGVVVIIGHGDDLLIDRVDEF